MTVGFALPWDEDEPAVPSPDLPSAASAVRRRGRRPAAAPGQTSPDWLYHHLTIHGPETLLRAFADAARGSGLIPWRLDFARIEEDVFLLAAAQPPARRNLTIDGCRILARQFCECVAARRARAMALVGRSRACPFDLHTLLPVPPDILERGSTDPAALAWLAANWGIPDQPRHVVERPAPGIGRRLPRGHAVIGYGFFTPGETPGTAIAALAARWPGLEFRLQPRPAD